MMTLVRFAVLIAGAVAASAATAAPTVLYDGSSVPVAQGWAHVFDGGTETVGTGGSAGTTAFSTATTPGGRTSPYSTYAYATGATNFIASIRLRVDSAAYNNLDGGLMFNVFGNNGLGGIFGFERFSNLMFSTTNVIWGDFAQTIAIDTTVFHEYALRYRNGALDLFIDTSYDDIEAGTALAVMSRSAALVQQRPVIAGLINFGDLTNDPNFDSSYVVDFVNFQNLDAVGAVPEPTSLALVGLAMALAGVAGRRRRCQA